MRGRRVSRSLCGHPKVGDRVTSKTDPAMVNEVLGIRPCRNLCRLIQEQEELDIIPVFYKEAEAAAC